MIANFTRGQLAKLTATARLFGCTEADLVVALAMGNLAMHGRMEGTHGEGLENAESIGEFIEQFVHERQTPSFDPSNLNLSRLVADGRFQPQGLKGRAA